jgi:hypothetical protein
VVADAGKQKLKKEKKLIHFSNDVSLEWVYAGWVFW